MCNNKYYYHTYIQLTKLLTTIEPPFCLKITGLRRRDLSALSESEIRKDRPFVIDRIELFL